MKFGIKVKEIEDGEYETTIVLDDRAMDLLDHLVDAERAEIVSTCDKEDARNIASNIYYANNSPDEYKINSEEDISKLKEKLDLHQKVMGYIIRRIEENGIKKAAETHESIRKVLIQAGMMCRVSRLCYKPEKCKHLIEDRFRVDDEFASKHYRYDCAIKKKPCIRD
jgi:hypothetical protein